MCGTKLLYAVDELRLNRRDVLEVLMVGTDSFIHVGWDGVRSCDLNGFVGIVADPAWVGAEASRICSLIVEVGVTR